MARKASRIEMGIMACWGMAMGVAVLGAFASEFTTGKNAIGQLTAAPSNSSETAPSSASQPTKTQQWLLNNPAPHIIPEGKANPSAVPDKFASRAHAMEQRATLRAYEGAPPVIPHAIAGINIQSCRACHAEGLNAGDKVARMASHAYLINCTQCHVEAKSPWLDDNDTTVNSFVGLRSSGFGSPRPWAGAPPVIPHATFMRTNCISCHGEHGYDGWRPDHLSRTNCTQCHAPGAELDQLSPTFSIPAVVPRVSSP